MTQVFIPDTSNINILTPEKISEIVQLTTGDTEYEIIKEDRNSGQYIKVVDENRKTFYVCYSNNNPSRNTRLIQPFPPAYIAYNNDTNSDKELCVYIVARDTTDRTESAKFIYRCLSTISVKILNYTNLFSDTLSGFSNYSEMKQMKVSLSERNFGNNPSYFTDDDNQISLFAKVDGVNAKESFLLALVLRELVSIKVVVYPVYRKPNDNFTGAEQNVLLDVGLIIGQRINTISNADIEIDLSMSDDILRNTPKFHYNLLKKFGEEKRCYLCGCDIEHLIIGAHIERVADIKRNKEYSSKVKKERVVDGDNGLWLCANHDKMFEFGIVYFENDLLRIGAFVKDIFSKSFIYGSIFETITIYPDDLENVGTMDNFGFRIRPQHYNARMRDYCRKHISRVV